MDLFLVCIFYLVAILGFCAFGIDEALAYLHCDHVWQQTGLWDGKDQNRNRVAGPLAKCIKCNKPTDFHWEDWRAIPKEKKIELFPR